MSTTEPGKTQFDPEMVAPGTRARTDNTRDLARRPSPAQRVKDLWEYRELLTNLVRKELKIKYKNSALGFVWSLLNPALYLVVFWLVFGLILGSGIPQFPIFLLCGLVPWNFFGNSMGSGATSITDNASLVGKVWFPREVLPMAAIGAGIVHFFLQATVLIAGLLVFRVVPSPEYSLLLIPALITMVLFLAAACTFFSAVNVYLRDTQHLLELLLLAWFWMTPIVYPYYQVANKMGQWSALYFLNPMVSVVITFQRALYNRTSFTSKGVTTQLIPDESVWWYLRNLVLVSAGSIALLFIALTIFGRLEDNFAEEI